MPKNGNRTAEIDDELETVDSAIMALATELEDLKRKRYELIAMRNSLSIQEAVECIIENDIPVSEIMEFVAAVQKRKNNHSS